ncbi:type I DNA topoisomerase [Mucilaginibacter sp. BT774]|uniref:type I DNA topoisomerase n=1 Tax=Mucilaginibacter sp. BT774 TaxID=3062276 RepID=UPI002676C1F2|nr:type I DNA topoisomerase [Mucilaginibacter sp. BT774]MDO3625222.1 type I DNA topoisomerase [Mucilaginibacter sp. BT774]
MAKNLLIVESPAKAKTIEGYLGKDFTVKSSYGHIRDLVKSEDAIDIANNFAQKYEVPADKKQVVSELKKLAKEAEMVWLASDEDREGEAISWHLFETLGLKDASTKRIVFHEITKPAILKAIENPRKIDYNLVNAQQARRVLDRLVGFELSPVLWKKVKPSLSAGRVQSVAVRLIVDREREINKFQSEAAFKIVAIFGKGKEAFKAELSERWAKQEDAEKFLKDCIGADFNVNSLETKPAKRSPAAPFTTSTLQQEASRKLGFSVSRTMQVAQKLYESGKITYMRTDSVNLSDTALNAAAKEINSAYGEKYHQIRKYKTKSAGAQEAHEAIRPTYFDAHTIDGDPSEKRLYELIWKRAIASQMSEALFEKTTAKISISTRKEELVANGEVMKFDGFLKVYLESVDDDEDTQSDEDNAMLPPLTKGQRLDMQEITATERFSRPAARYTEASLVKKLEELGIGRPSTYAPTISTIQNRGYVVKEDREGKQRNFRVLTLKGTNITKEEKTENTGAERGKLFPTDIGSVVNDFLVQYFKGIVDYHFTAGVEKQFDEIAQGLEEWTDMIRKFYNPFHKEVQNTIETADKATGERDLGVHPDNGKKVSVRIGRFGPFVQIGDSDTEEKPLYASLRAGQSIETIALEDALELFKLPKKVGLFEDKEMTVAIGKFGPYIRHNSAFYSLPKDIDPLDVSEEQAIEIILDKRKRDSERLIKTFDENPDVKILNGRWGPYIEFGKQNVKIPKGKEPKDLTYEECKALAEAEAKAPKKKFVKKK